MILPACHSLHIYIKKKKKKTLHMRNLLNLAACWCVLWPRTFFNITESSKFWAFPSEDCYIDFFPVWVLNNGRLSHIHMIWNCIVHTLSIVASVWAIKYSYKPESLAKCNTRYVDLISANVNSIFKMWHSEKVSFWMECLILGIVSPCLLCLWKIHERKNLWVKVQVLIPRCRMATGPRTYTSALM